VPPIIPPAVRQAAEVACGIVLFRGGLLLPVTWRPEARFTGLHPALRRDCGTKWNGDDTVYVGADAGSVAHVCLCLTHQVSSDGPWRLKRKKGQSARFNDQGRTFMGPSRRMIYTRGAHPHAKQAI